MSNKLIKQTIMAAVSALVAASAFAGNAWAEGAAANPNEGFASLIPMILIMVIFWVLLIRPQQKRLKAHGEMIQALKKGDKVITGGGFYGEIMDVKEDHLVVEIAENVRVKVKQDTILTKQTSSDSEQ